MPADLRFELLNFGIDVDYKHKRASYGIEGVSFRYKNICFKGSQVDRKYSFANLKKEFLNNCKVIGNKVEEMQQAKPIKPKEVSQPPMPNPPKKEELMKIGGVKITPEQATILKEGGYIYLENMTNSKGQLFSGYVIINEEQQRAFMFKNRPDEFVKYGKYEMRGIDNLNNCFYLCHKLINLLKAEQTKEVNSLLIRYLFLICRTSKY